MEMKALGPGAGWSWLMRGIKSGFRRPKTLFGAAALFLAFAVMIGILQFIAQLVPGQSLTAVLAFYGAMMVATAAVYPVLCGGYLRILEAVEYGRSASALDVLAPFRPGGGGGRMAMVGIGLILIYALFLVLLYFTVGHGVGAWYMQVMQLGMHGADKPAALPPLPGGFAVTFALLMVFLIFYSAAFAIAVGQAALRDQPTLTSLKDGIIGALKNLLPLLVLVVCSFLAFMVLVVALSIVVVVITMLGSLLGSMFAMILMVPMYAAMMLLMYLVMFGVMYALWQDVADHGQHEVGKPPTAHLEI